ncbi:CARDB domain-containing protein [Kineococcus indalonis]|uniref:CARDB domain-containing protein n=1 Tax=Kineococcus indalonis TaxID=2696566 RepID=UPI001411BF25|nr:CARDB domain-containing protein [Kineococcus indalonis]NAZ85087.1 hypothetical protein [Kineococcus indalonis]
MATKSSRSARGVGRFTAALAAATALGTTVGVAPASAAPELPDLVVTDVSPAVGSYVQGSRVVFQATVRNVGTTAKEWGAVVGVSFAVDGRVVSWSDDSATSIAPGESVTLRANAGPTGSNTWAVSAGHHTVRAWVDDVDRIPEADERRNTLQRSVRVQRAGAKAVTARPAATPERFRATHDASVVVSWRVPAGQPAGTTYTVVERPGAQSFCTDPVDVAPVTTTGTSVTVQQQLGTTCSGHASGHTSSFTVVAHPPRGGAVESAASGTCEQVSGTDVWAPGAPERFWALACEGFPELRDTATAS